MTDNLRDARKAGKSRDKRDIVSDKVKRWPDGVVPFTIDSSIGEYDKC